MLLFLLKSLCIRHGINVFCIPYTKLMSFILTWCCYTSDRCASNCVPWTNMNWMVCCHFKIKIFDYNKVLPISFNYPPRITVVGACSLRRKTQTLSISLWEGLSCHGFWGIQLLVQNASPQRQMSKTGSALLSPQWVSTACTSPRNPADSHLIPLQAGGHYSEIDDVT